MSNRAIVRLLRSKAFRLSLQSTIISGVGALIVSAAIYYAAESTIRRELDTTVKNERGEIISGANAGNEQIENNVRKELHDASGTFYALVLPSGKMLVGNLNIPLSVMMKWHRYKTLTRRDGLTLPRHVLAIRGVATNLGNGNILYIAEKANELIALNNFFSRSFLALMGGILGFGMAGGFLVARSALRRVEAIATASQEIMAGNLARRIDVDGSKDEFDRLAISLNGMLDRIAILMKNIQQVSNDISHDLRSPLARLRENLEISRTIAPDASMSACFDEAITQVDTVLGIFSAMLRIAEIESSAMRTHFLPVNISTLLEDMAETFKVVAKAEHKMVSANIAAGLEVIGDRELLEQMFVNVIENAILYSPPGGDISINAGLSQARTVDIEIADRGPGIPASEHKRVLQRFVRLDASRHNPGTGLGLALVAAIVDLHDSVVSFADNVPGLKVLIRIPRISERSSLHPTEPEYLDKFTQP